MPKLYETEAATHTAPITADTLVKSGPGIYAGYTVTTVTAVGVIQIRDAVAAGQGTIIDVIPLGTAAGATKLRNVKFKTGLFVDYAASVTGTVIVEFM